jgi:N6-adenosine-specific RNA methylase IME4
MLDLARLPQREQKAAIFDDRLRLLVSALGEARSFADLADISHEAETLRALLKRQRLGLQAQQQAALLKIEAETRIGEMLAEIERQPPGRPRRNDSPGIVLPRLRDLGLSPGIAHRALRLAALPRWLREGTIRYALDHQREMTTKWLLMRCESDMQRQRNLEPQPGGRVEDLFALASSGQKFGCLYLDPPWPIPGLTLPYPSMTLEEIAALPIRELADPRRCHLHIWCLGGRITEAAYSLVRHWHFRPVSDFVWVKSDGLGSGQYWRAAHETLLTCVLAHSKSDGFADHGLKSVGQFRRGRHSVKPPEVRRMIEVASPPPRLELFAREVAVGWVAWGDEITMPIDQQVAR